MLKSAVFLFVLGLALGLCFGFNPQSHQAALQKWEGAKAAFVKMETDFSVSVGAWTTKAKAQTNISPQPTVTSAASKPFSSLWQQIVSAWSAFAASLQGSLHRLAADANLKR